MRPRFFSRSASDWLARPRPTCTAPPTTPATGSTTAPAMPAAGGRRQQCVRASPSRRGRMRGIRHACCLAACRTAPTAPATRDARTCGQALGEAGGALLLRADDGRCEQPHHARHDARRGRGRAAFQARRGVLGLGLAHGVLPLLLERLTRLTRLLSGVLGALCLDGTPRRALLLLLLCWRARRGSVCRRRRCLRCCLHACDRIKKCVWHRDTASHRAGVAGWPEHRASASDGRNFLAAGVGVAERAMCVQRVENCVVSCDDHGTAQGLLSSRPAARAGVRRVTCTPVKFFAVEDKSRWPTMQH
jgi:hypothetical protein